MKYKIVSLLIFFFSVGCTQHNLQNESSSLIYYKSIDLNVKELKIELQEDLFKGLDEDIAFAKKETYLKLKEWSNQKFRVLGNKNKAILKVIGPEMILKKKKEKLILKKILLYNEKIYLITTKVLLSFIMSEGNSKKIEISSRIDLSLKDNMSLNNREIVIQKTIEKLISAIDLEINKMLEKNEFIELVIKK